MNRLVIISLMAAVGVAPGPAQKKPLSFFVAYEKGKAYLLLVDAPAKMKGFNALKRIDGEFRLLNEELIESEKDPASFRDILGEDYNWLRSALKAENETQVVRRIQSDRGSSFAFSLASLRIARAVGRLFVDTTAEEGEEYTYRIAYVDFRGKEFDWRDRTVRLEETEPPVPTELKAEPGDGKVKLSWQYESYSGDPTDITVGFNIYREEEKAPPKRVNTVLVLRQEGHLSRLDDDVENGTSYTYTIRAVDFIGRESEPSEPVSLVPRDVNAPAAPRGLVATPQEGRILVGWKTGVESDISLYDIYRGFSSQGEFTKINSQPIPASVTSFVDSGVVFGPYYFYRVKATDKSGNESKLSAAIPARPDDRTAPLPPAELTGSVEGRTVVLRWKASASKDTRGYYVYRGGHRENLLRLVGLPLPADSTVYTDVGFNMKGLNSGATYRYAVSSLDTANNESTRLAVSVRIPDDQAPAAPFDVRARTDEAGVIEVGWQPSPSLDVTAFRVYRSHEASAPLVIATVHGFGLRDSSVARGVRYEYRVSAVDSSGNEGEKSASASATARSIYLAPVPKDIEATFTESGVALAWSPVDSRELQGYNVYRCERIAGEYRKLNREIHTATSYTDPDGRAGFFYKVTSVTTSGYENTGGRTVTAAPRRQ